MTEIRDLREDEVPFLEEMLYAALAWRADVELPPPEWVLAHPQVVVFHEGWGREGDVGLVAEVDGAPVGLAWYRFFTEAEHGEGFVDEATPEVAVAVVDGPPRTGDRPGAHGGDPCSCSRAGRDCSSR